MLNDQIEIVLVLGALAILSDYADGFFARKLNQITEFGKLMDPIADKAFVLTLTTLMIIKGLIPSHLAITLIARDILILLGGIYSSKRLGYILPSNLTGKIAVNFVALVFIGVLLDNSFAKNEGAIFVSLFLIYSFFVYLFRMILELKKKRKVF